jgi:Domain of unknown function (DUF4167)
MRNGQKRMRGRNNNNHRKSQNPLTRVYESNGPDVKIRGTASHIAEKYIQLARDAQSSGDPVAAENYYQHAEHYFRLIAAAQEQFRQQNPYYNQQGQPGTPAPQGAADDGYDDGDDDQPSFMGQNEPSYVPQPQPPQGQPYIPRDAQPFPPRDQQQNIRPQPQPSYPQPSINDGAEMGGLPAFITGGGGGQPQPQQNGGGQNGHDAQGERGDRFGHRRRRRHRGGFRGERGDFGGNAQGAAPQGDGDQPE